jgi:hypothetical protein
MDIKSVDDLLELHAALAARLLDTLERVERRKAGEEGQPDEEDRKQLIGLLEMRINAAGAARERSIERYEGEIRRYEELMAQLRGGPDVPRAPNGRKGGAPRPRAKSQKRRPRRDG